MRRLELPLELPSLRMILVVTIVLLVALGMGPSILVLHLGFRELAIFTLAILMGLLIFIPSKSVMRLGFVLWILTFALGWRTIHLTSNLNIHPAEVLAVLLFVAVLARSIVSRSNLDLSLPIPILLLMVFSILGVFTALARGTALDLILQEFKIFAVLVPSYYVVKWLVVTRKDWERAALLTVPVAVYVSGLGLMDYFAPNLSQAISGDPSVVALYQAESYGAAPAFARVGFIFYGNFMAGFLIFMFFGLSVYFFLQSFRKNAVAQAITGFALLVEVAGMYLSGYRGLWYAVGAFLVAYAVVQRRAWLVVGVAIVSLPVLPAQFRDRFQSLFNLQYADSSQFDRIFRATQAFKLMIQSPLTGVGWAGSGYVHSDLIQICANLGIPALMVFVLWILNLIWQMFRLGQQRRWASGYAGALLATLCGLMLVFAGEGLIVWQQMMIPVWFLLAMCYKLIELDDKETEPIVSPVPEIASDM